MGDKLCSGLPARVGRRQTAPHARGAEVREEAGEGKRPRLHLGPPRRDGTEPHRRDARAAARRRPAVVAALLRRAARPDGRVDEGRPRAHPRRAIEAARGRELADWLVVQWFIHSFTG